MLSLSMPVELLVSILNCYLRSKYSSLDILCENENLDYSELITILNNNNYSYNEDSNQIR